MAQNVTAEGEFQWTEQKLEAAMLVALDELTDEAIAVKLDIHRRTLARWKTHPEFQQHVAELLEAWKAEVRRHGVAIKERRIAALQRLHDKLLRVIEQRAIDPSMQGVPGGDTGLMVRTQKFVKVYGTREAMLEMLGAALGEDGSGDKDGGEKLPESVEGELYNLKRTVLVSEYAFDAAIVKAILEIEKQVATELGQITTKTEQTTTGALVVGSSSSIDLEKLKKVREIIRGEDDEE